MTTRFCGAAVSSEPPSKRKHGKPGLLRRHLRGAVGVLSAPAASTAAAARLHGELSGVAGAPDSSGSAVSSLGGRRTAPEEERGVLCDL